MTHYTKKKFAVFASGHGSNLQAIIEATRAGDITADLALVFSNLRKARALERAREAGVETLCLVSKDYATPQSYERDIVIQLKDRDIDFIVLAGYMKIFTPYFIREFPNRIINIHPSLLPAFKGKQGIKDTFTYGTKVAGVTIHFVNDRMDAGPIIAQEAIRVKDDDTLESLEEKVHKLEHKMYPAAIQLYVENRLKIAGRKVHILPG
jgi:phosphoribosylglycinamide formyltransferase-1